MQYSTRDEKKYLIGKYAYENSKKAAKLHFFPNSAKITSTLVSTVQRAEMFYGKFEIGK
jgi:hypothetical protein